MKTTEEALIQRIRRRVTSPKLGQLQLGIGDDAAIFTPRTGYEAVLTCDWFLEGSHFLARKHPADSIGWKCLARGLSDIAAMGGEPRCFLMSLALPEACIGRWLDEFLSGLRRCARRYRCALAGGDTTESRHILISVTVVGEVKRGRAVQRSGARPGDALFVSGRLGEAQLGLERLRRSKSNRGLEAWPELKKHLYPEPRLALGQWLSNKGLATAMMDLSDGLSTDLSRLCIASGVGAAIEAARIPLPRSGYAQAKTEALRLGLNGGDDYELLFSVAPDQAERVPQYFQGIKLTSRIGTITRRRDLRLILPDGRKEPLLPKGWDPFRS